MGRRKLGIAVLLLLSVGLLIGGMLVWEPLAKQMEETKEEIQLPAWANVELVDAVSGETFRIADFAGQPILIESFAVWCSICLRQQREMQRLSELEGGSVIHISLDTDPNEDLDKVRAHALRHGFTWLYAVSPIEMTEALIADFGLTVVNAPRAPVLFIDSKGTAELLPNGVKTAEELIELIDLEPDQEGER